ncbi:hypothetical protein [Agromyces sp. Root81]|uniref:hypothetical protein n=1 Tax=Agromyces sp. Root81 TaxID=1736601 RepID=UPI0012FB8961|nr:hypothetical protein [Agromyces sp. Root81]
MPSVVHLRKDRPALVQLVKWKPGTDEYELVAGYLTGRNATTWYLVTDEGPLELDREAWLVCDDGEDEMAEAA